MHIAEVYRLHLLFANISQENLSRLLDLAVVMWSIRKKEPRHQDSGQPPCAVLGSGVLVQTRGFIFPALRADKMYVAMIAVDMCLCRTRVLSQREQ